MFFRDIKTPIATGGDVARMTDRYKDAYVKNNQKSTVVPCKPLSEYIHGAGIKHIDLFSLDVEGSEPLVLSTMDWTIPVKVFIIEYNERTQDTIKHVMTEHGYVQSSFNVRNLCSPKKDCASNLVFVNKRYGYTF